MLAYTHPSMFAYTAAPMRLSVCLHVLRIRVYMQTCTRAYIWMHAFVCLCACVCPISMFFHVFVIYLQTSNSCERACICLPDCQYIWIHLWLFIYKCARTESYVHVCLVLTFVWMRMPSCKHTLPAIHTHANS